MKNNGFTLIELLAVIVILAIIALIATPIILNIIDSANVQSAERSAAFYIDALNLAVERKILNNPLYSFQDKEYQIMKDGNLCLGNYFNEVCDAEVLKVEVDKTTATGGIVYINSNKISKVINLRIGEYVFSFNSNGLVISNANYDKWDGRSATAIADLLIDEDTKTVTVNSASDLAGVRNAINSGNLKSYNIVLNSSIDLNGNEWEPIGIAASSVLADTDTPFTGTFDGNGYTIKGINVVRKQSQGSRSVGLFGTVVGEVTVKNLNIEGSVTSDFTTAGGLIAISVDKGDVPTNVTITNCNIDMAVTSKDGTGGVIGRAYNSGTTTITNTVNNGVITSNTKASGFVAYNSGSALSIVNSINNGEVTGGTIEGGFIGYADAGVNVLIKDCINNGNMTSNGTAGGIAGNIRENASSIKHSGTFENCINNGTITSSSFGGGIIGSLEGEWLLLDNVNNGNVESTRGENVGGIIGMAKYSITIQNNKNKAELSSSSAVGGIIGRYEVQNLYSQYENYNLIVRNSSGGTVDLLKGTANTKAGVIAYQRIKTTYKDLVTITIENSSMNGINDVKLVSYN